MIDAQITDDHATVRIVSGALDVTYEVRSTELWSWRRRYNGGYYSRTGKQGYALDLVGVTRDPNKGQAPYIFGSLDFERAVSRALSKARHLERVWRNTRSKSLAVAA